MEGCFLYIVVQSYHAECLLPNLLFELVLSTWEIESYDFCSQNTTHPSDALVWHLNKMYVSKLNGISAVQRHPLNYWVLGGLVESLPSIDSFGKKHQVLNGIS